MFDNSTRTNVWNSQSVNAVSGTLVKSHPKSYFIYGHRGSKNTDNLMYENPKEIILQAMLIGDGYLLYEVVSKKDWEQTVKRWDDVGDGR